MAVIRSATAVPGTTYAGQELRIALIASGSDVADDRDLIDRVCLPEVRRHCRARSISFAETALVTGEETARDLSANRVASVLDTIRRDRPIILSLLGRVRGTPVPERVLRSRTLLSRHPWLEHIAGEGMSLAEIAMLEGVLGNPLMSDRLIVAVRTDVPSRAVKRRVDPLAALAGRVRDAGMATITGYDDDRRALADRLSAETIALVDKLRPDMMPSSPLEQVRRAQEAFASSRRQAYVEVSGYREQLDAHVELSGAPLAVTGAAGSGKSALLANWIARYRERLPNAFIIEHYAAGAGSESSHFAILRQIMTEIRERYSLTDEVPSAPAELVDALPLWLAHVQHERLVLVLDGLDQLAPDSRDLEWLPRHFPPQIRLIVSCSDGPMSKLLRTRGWNALRLKPLTLSERRSVTREFLGERSRRLTGEQLRRVTNDSSSANPLFLRIRLEELRAHGPAGRLNERIDSFLDAGDLDKLFDRVLERLERSHDEALVRTVMALLWASRRGLTVADLDALVKPRGEELADLLGALDFHLISRDGLLTFFHDCMRHAVASRYDLSSVAVARTVHKRLSRYFGTLPMSRRRAIEEPWQHFRCGNVRKLRECLGSIEMFMELAQGETEYELLGYWTALGSLEDMALVYDKTIEQYESVPSSTVPTAVVLDTVGRFLHHAGLYQRSEQLMMRAVELSHKELGAGDPRTMEITKHRLQILLELGRYTESAEACEQMIAEIEPAHGDAHPVMIDTLTMLADAKHYLGELHEAEATARRAVQACERTYGPEHPALAEALFNLSAILRDRGEFSLAESLLRRVLVIDERVHGEDHPTTAMTRSDLGHLLCRTGRNDEGEEFLQRSRAIREGILGPDHPHTAQSYHQLGRLYADLERYDESERYYTDATRVFERTLGPDHPNFAASLANLALTLERKGDATAAEAHFRRALAIIEKSLGSEHTMAIRLIGHIGRTLLVSGQLDDAEEYVARAYNHSLQRHGETHHDTASIALTLADIMRQRAEYLGAERHIRSAIRAFEQLNGAHHIDTVRATLKLAELEAERGNVNEALKACTSVVATLESIGADDRSIARTARELLADLETRSMHDVPYASPVSN